MINKVSDLFPNSVKLGWRSRWMLRRAGWSPSRKVRIAGWRDRLVAENWPVTPEMETILQSFGGLIIEIRCCGVQVSTLDLNPHHGSDFEEHSYIERMMEPFIYDQVCVIGVWNHLGSILIGRKGVYLFMENCVALIGHCWIEALDTLISSGSKNLIWRSCIDERPSVVLDGMPETTQ